MQISGSCNHRLCFQSHVIKHGHFTTALAFHYCFQILLTYFSSHPEFVWLQILQWPLRPAYRQWVCAPVQDICACISSRNYLYLCLNFYSLSINYLDRLLLILSLVPFPSHPSFLSPCCQCMHCSPLAFCHAFNHPATVHPSLFVVLSIDMLSVCVLLLVHYSQALGR